MIVRTQFTDVLFVIVPLFISEHTVHRHVANTLTKLNASFRSAAVAQAGRLGLL